jgi:sec-independent protein translocase protein TatA
MGAINMFNINGMEWWILLIIVLLIFGPSRLPGLFRSLGKSIGEFRKGVKEAHEDVTEGITDNTKKPDDPESLKSV